MTEYSFFIDEMVHLSLALCVGVIFYLKGKDWRIFLVVILFGFLIDIDHLFDYFAHFGARFRLRDFFNVSTYVIPSRKIYVLWHGWEYLLLINLLTPRLARKYRVKYLPSAALGSYFFHLLWDNFGVYANTHPLAYFIAYRAASGFSLESFAGSML